MPEDQIIKEISEFSKNLRKKILKMSLNAGSASAHIGGALSIADIVSILFKHKMKKNNKNGKEDRFILSKGHACLAYYSALNLIGKISDEELNTFEKDNTNLPGHPVKNRDLGIDFSTGSLGMGLSIGIGLAISSIKKKEFFKVYVVLGDGECNEGSVWEAAMAAPKFKLNNLNVIIDKNNFQQTGQNLEIMDLKSLHDKWSSFGWNVKELDGHDLPQMLKYFSETETNDKPNLLVANTVKGKGFSLTENNNAWHHSIMTEKLYNEAIKEIE
jgi:transketolase